MTFSRVNPVGWAPFEELTSAQMNAIDINVSQAIDGVGGGTYSPTEQIVIAGAGARFDSSLEIGEAGRFLSPGALALSMQVVTFESISLLTNVGAAESKSLGVAHYGYSAVGEAGSILGTGLIYCPITAVPSDVSGIATEPAREKFVFCGVNNNGICESIEQGMTGKAGTGSSNFDRAAVDPNSGIGIQCQHTGSVAPSGSPTQVLGRRTTDCWGAASPATFQIDWSSMGNTRYCGAVTFFEKTSEFIVGPGGGITGNSDPAYVDGGTVLRSADGASGTWNNANPMPTDWVNNDRDVWCWAQSPTCLIGPARVNQGVSYAATGEFTSPTSGADDTTAYLRSEDGVTFSQLNFPSALRARSAGYNKVSQTFLVGGHDAKLMKSTDDGLTFTDITPSFQTMANDKLCWVGLQNVGGVWIGVLMAYDYDQVTIATPEHLGTVILHSFDEGSTWRYSSSAGKIGPLSTQAGGGRFYAAALRMVPKNPNVTRDKTDGDLHLIRSLGALETPPLF